MSGWPNGLGKTIVVDGVEQPTRGTLYLEAGDGITLEVTDSEGSDHTKVKVTGGSSASVNRMPVRAATAEALPAHTTVGNVMTMNAFAVLTVDGKAIVAGDDIAVCAEGASHAEHGFWTCTVTGVAGELGAAAVLTRRGDANTSAEMIPGMTVRVREGDRYAGYTARLSTTGTIVLNATALAFVLEAPIDGTAPNAVILPHEVLAYPADDGSDDAAALQALLAGDRPVQLMSVTRAGAAAAYDFQTALEVPRSAVLGCASAVQITRTVAQATDVEQFALDAARGPAQYARRVIQLLGDSNTVGNDGQAGWRTPLYATLRQWRDNFELVGTHADVPLASGGTLGAWFHDAVAGYKMSDVTAAYAGWAAALQDDPNVIVDMIGTNDVAAGTSAANMLIARAAMDAVIDGEFPNARRIVIAVPTFVAGTTVAGNLAAWNAVVSAYNILLADYCATNGYDFIEHEPMAGGDIGPDGVHLTIRGAAVLGRQIANFLDAYVLGARAGGVLPRQMVQRDPWLAAYMVTAGTDKMAHASHAGFKPGAESFAVELWWYANALESGLRSIVEYNLFAGSPNFWGLFTNGRAFRAYFASQVARFDVNSPSALAASPGCWHRLVLLAHYDGAASSLGLYDNAECIGLVTGLAAWDAMTQQAITFGKGNDANVAVSYYGSLAAFKGSAIPRPGTMAAMRAVEADYYEARQLVPGACSASYPLSTTLADEIDGNPSLAYTGATSAAAWPAGAPRRPCDIFRQPALDNRGQATVGGGGTIAVAYTDIRANSVPRLAAVSGTGICTCAVTAHVGFTITGTAGDVWAWEVE